MATENDEYAPPTDPQSVVKVTDDEALAKWVRYCQGDLRCPCGYSFAPLGRFLGVDMGKGWVRTTTEPDCPHHGTKASEARRARHAAQARQRRTR